MLEKTALISLDEVELSPAEEKLDRIQYNTFIQKYKKFFSYYDFGDGWVFYIREYLWKLFLYRDRGESEVLIYDFEKVSKDKINIVAVYNTPYFVIGVDGKNYLFHNDTTAFRGLDLSVPVQYGKEGDDTDEIILVTDKWSYLHNLDSKKSAYYYQFHDFIYTADENILWLIRPQDTNKRNNLSLPKNDMYYVIRYNQNTKESQNVYQTIDRVSQMYFQDETLILEVWGERKQLKNY